LLYLLIREPGRGATTEMQLPDNRLPSELLEDEIRLTLECIKKACAFVALASHHLVTGL